MIELTLSARSGVFWLSRLLAGLCLNQTNRQTGKRSDRQRNRQTEAFSRAMLESHKKTDKQRRGRIISQLIATFG